jgi:hypothetical protein
MGVVKVKPGPLLDGEGQAGHEVPKRGISGKEEISGKKGKIWVFRGGGLMARWGVLHSSTFLKSSMI